MPSQLFRRSSRKDIIVENITDELEEIGKILAGACMMNAIRRESTIALQGKRARVVKGSMADVPQYEIIVIYEGGAVAGGQVARRLRGSIDGIEESQIERIADNMIGIKKRSADVR